MRNVAEPGISQGNLWLSRPGDRADGAVAQLGEHLLCKQGVSGSIPLSSTKSIGVETDGNEAKASQAQGASPIVWRPRGAPSARER